MIYLPPDKSALIFALLFATGALLQILALKMRHKILAFVGVSLVLAAAVIDRDPTLAVGQIILALVPLFAGRKDT